MDITEFARLGGQARAKALTASRRKEIAVNAIRKRWGILASKNVASSSPILASKNDEPIKESIQYCAVCHKPYYTHDRYSTHKFQAKN